VRLPDTLLLVERAPKNGHSRPETQGDDTSSASPRPSLRELLAQVKANGNGKGGLEGEAREDRREERASSFKP